MSLIASLTNNVRQSDVFQTTELQVLQDAVCANNVGVKNAVSVDVMHSSSVNVSGPLKTWLDVTNFQGFPQEIISQIPLSSAIDPSILSLVPASTRYQAGCLAPNKNIYCIPSNALLPVLVIDTQTDTLSIIPRGNIVGTWRGGVYAPDGNIYCAPSLSETILVIHTATNTVSTIPLPQPMVTKSNNSGGYFWGAVYANSKIVFIAHDSVQFVAIDLAVNPLNAFFPPGLAPPNPVQSSNPWGGNPENSNWAGGVIGTDGNIYTVPHNRSNSNSILRIDPVTLTYTVAVNQASPLSGDNFMFSGGVLHPTGEIFFMPRKGIQNDRKIAKLGPAGVYNTLTRLDPANTGISTSFNTIFYGGILANNGVIYGIPGSSKFMMKVLPDGTVNQGVDVSYLYPSGPGVNANYRVFFGAVAAPNNKIYLIPWSADGVGVMKTGLPTLFGWNQQALFNKV